tara:strand:- start:38 stop:1594 length:1557 start_codon:yes stop_codon:yes gene_type:complete
MKCKLNIFLILIFTLLSSVRSQNLSDALNYIDNSYQGTARFNSMSGAFGALGGDLSSIAINPASSAIFNKGHFSLSFGSDNKSGQASLLNASNNFNKNNLTLNQIGGVINFENLNRDNKWKKISIGITYNQSKNNFNEFSIFNISNNNSIDSYFLNNAQGLRLDQISAFQGESITDAYVDIGNTFGYAHQQAFLGYESFIIEPSEFSNNNSSYYSNVPAGTFSQSYSSISRGYNGKLSFNAGFQYDDNFYFGINLNSHFIDYDNYTIFNESNTNGNSGEFRINGIYFENRLSTYGEGFSAQFGFISKLSNVVRVGFTYNSPTWYTIYEETRQYLETSIIDELDESSLLVTNPNAINIYEDYKFKTPSKFTASTALVFKRFGLISFDYSRRDYSSIKFNPKNDIHFSNLNQEISTRLKEVNTYRAGAEILVDRLSFRFGLMYEDSPYSLNPTFESNNLDDSIKAYSIGLGYKLNATTIDLSLVTVGSKKFNRLYDTGLTNQISLDSNNKLFTISVSTIF